MQKIFFTGFPGFLGSELLPRVLARSPEDTAVCLVQDKFMDMAQERVEVLNREHPVTRDRIELVVGDITREGLGLADPSGLQQETRELAQGALGG